MQDDRIALDALERSSKTQLSARSRVKILGISVDTLTEDQVVSLMAAWVSAQTKHYICVANVHTIMECLRKPAYRQVYEQASLITPDGMPLVWLSRLFGHIHAQRVYGPDLMLRLCAESERLPFKHYLFGSTDAVLALLEQKLVAQFPNLKIVGKFSPPYNPSITTLTTEELEAINATNPDIIWVGLGAPKQEYWMNHYRSQLNAPILIGVGAAFDFHAGAKRQAPRYLQQLGLEWLFRLLTEPRRLWRRYLFNIPPFVILVALQLLGLRNSDREETPPTENSKPPQASK